MTDILLLTIDSLRADRLGQNGYRRDTSPFLDQLADHAIVYENAIANGPTTFTSFPSIFTGSHAYQNPNFPELEGPTIAEYFNNNGYHTRSVTSNVWTSPTYGYDSGFDEVYHLGRGPRAANSLWDRFRHRIGDILGDGVLYRGVKRAYDIVRESKSEGQPEEKTIHDRIIDHINSQKRTFTWGHYMTVHTPYTPDPAQSTQFLEKQISENKHRKIIDKARKNPATVTDQERQLLSNRYDAAIRHVDRRIEELLQAIDLDQTIVLLTADHGEGLWEHGYFEHPPKLHQQLLHVPLFILTPKTDPQVIDRPVDLASIPKTLAEFANSDPKDDFQTHALPPWGTAPEYVCSAVAHQSRFEPEKIARDDLKIAVRKSKWKIISKKDNTKTELYDLSSDLAESNELSDTYPEIAETLANRATEFANGLQFGTVNEIPEELSDQLSELGYLD